MKSSTMSASELSQQSELAVAIVGVAGRFPGADSVEELWSNLVNGVESIRRFSADELIAMGVDRDAIAAPGYVPVAGTLSNVKEFDAAFFGYSPREAELMDPQHRIFLECAWHALEDAAIVPERTCGTIGVFAGCGPTSYLIFNLVPHAELMAPENLLALLNGNGKDSLATRVAYKLNLKGPALTLQTACSTSLVAVHVAYQNLLSGQCDVALAGGSTVIVPERTGYVFQKGEIGSPDGHCRAFDDRAAGTVFSSGAGVVVLKRLDDALADGNHIYAVIRGSAINNDGAQKIGFTAPSIEGQAEVIAMAHAMANVDPRSISYVEAHGTGTTIGDPVEIQGLCRAFAAHTADRQFCAIGSLKTNIGHLDTAAGVAGLIKTAIALDRGLLPASLHFERANSQIRFEETPFFVNSALREWPRARTPRRAGVSSFGIGGTNAHVVLEEAPARGPSPARSIELLPISARTPAAFLQVAERLAQHLEATSDASLADVAPTLQVGRRAFLYRGIVVARTRGGAVESLRRLTPAPRVDDAAGGVVFLLPGQGSQYAGMSRDLYRELPAFRASIDECARLLVPHWGQDLRDLLVHPAGDSTALDRTDATQPALFALEYALAQLWLSCGVVPTAMVGHSVGQYVAACLAGVFSLEDGLRLVAARGRLMQATGRGGMLAVAAAPAVVEPWLGDALDLAAINGPTQCVVAGPRSSIEALHEALQARQIVSRVLPGERAFHSRLMEPALVAFEHELRGVKLSAPTIRIASNLNGGWMSDEEATSPRYWVEHLRGTVRFGDNVRSAVGAGGRLFIEVGPGRTLAGLVRASLESPAAITTVPSLSPQAGRSEHESLLEALGRVWASGVDVDLGVLNPSSDARRIPLPVYPFERQEYWIAPPSLRSGVPHIVGGTNRAAKGPVAISTRHARPSLAVAYAPPVDEVERELADIWEELIGIAGLGVDDDFFEIGGDSLVAVRLVARIRERLGIELDVRALFDCTTIARLAARVREELGGRANDGEMKQFLELVEGMSDEEAEGLLATWHERIA
jgi:acyl transferase domain-containing protein/acyl carrier protein